MVGRTIQKRAVQVITVLLLLRRSRTQSHLQATGSCPACWRTGASVQMGCAPTTYNAKDRNCQRWTEVLPFVKQAAGGGCPSHATASSIFDYSSDGSGLCVVPAAEEQLLRSTTFSSLLPFELCNVSDLVTFLRHRTRSCEEDRILATKGRFKILLLPGACSFEDFDKVLEERRAILVEVRGRER